MMTDTSLLKSKMVLAGDDDFVQCISIILGVSRQTASDKLYGKSEFTQTQITELANHYGWTAEEIEQIFLQRGEQCESF